MPLSKQRIHPGGETDYPWEREAVDHVLRVLDDVDPYQAWPLQEFSDPSTGSLYEVDMVVLGKHALYLIEIKSHPGVLQGDSVDWYFFDKAANRTRTIDNPYSLTNKKAKSLKSLLDRQMKGKCPVRVEALLFVSNATRGKLSPYGNERLVLKDEIKKAITHGEKLPEWQRRHHVVNRPAMRDIAKALHAIGLRASKVSRLIGQ